MKKTLCFVIVAVLATGCASVDMPVADGSGRVMSFKGFAADMTIDIPSPPDADGNPVGDKTVQINAHILEGPFLEAVKSIAPFAAMATQ